MPLQRLPTDPLRTFLLLRSGGARAASAYAITSEALATRFAQQALSLKAQQGHLAVSLLSPLSPPRLPPLQVRASPSRKRMRSRVLSRALARSPAPFALRPHTLTLLSLSSRSPAPQAALAHALAAVGRDLRR